jgi:hypothetical protein
MTSRARKSCAQGCAKGQCLTSSYCCMPSPENELKTPVRPITVRSRQSSGESATDGRHPDGVVSRSLKVAVLQPLEIGSDGCQRKINASLRPPQPRDLLEHFQAPITPSLI